MLRRFVRVATLCTCYDTLHVSVYSVCVRDFVCRARLCSVRDCVSIGGCARGAFGATRFMEPPSAAELLLGLYLIWKLLRKLFLKLSLKPVKTFGKTFAKLLRNLEKLEKTCIKNRQNLFTHISLIKKQFWSIPPYASFSPSTRWMQNIWNRTLNLSVKNFYHKNHMKNPNLVGNLFHLQ
jgi:hypothetical protein